MPDSPPSKTQTIRFGGFDLDLRAGELRKERVRIRLQEQPFQILAMLLEHPGQVVTREELRSKLWPADTFVDFDHGVNKAINKLTEALGDSADGPHFVETLAKRGYRFTGDIGHTTRHAPRIDSPFGNGNMLSWQPPICGSRAHPNDYWQPYGQ